ncbi:class I SAM-dependent methyltransferase [Variovorax atrisoli]|uniref:SAM-dependent methyltransferase n=1 Tax=Variovorax atrisoli TaxID=3394203 RepID=UPI000F7DD26F|nr:cyclopropane-fatty-acyl-phospholipid synthase family protein [Variovorax sp. 369]RTD84406.1 class I SAM-dependent methyltransferase [Variovorax sp. 369]
MPRASSTSAAIHWVEQGLVPDAAVRVGVRRLLRQRLVELDSGNPEAVARHSQAFFEELCKAPLALLPEKANEQHYELPAAFFAAVLGPHRKYSCCWWPEGVETLEQAEAAALAETCTRAGLADGQRILELGCGWGSLSLWMAERFPGSRITAVSNSNSQRMFITAQAAARGLRNLEVITCDFNDFETTERFDRVVSVEMFEHLRNWPRAFSNVARWLNPQGRFFMHVFVHREAPYPFEVRDASDWMSRYFFSGGMMPSDDLALRCQDDLRLLNQWRWNGRHYAKTSAAWLSRMDARREELMPLLESVYGERDASIWWTRWRLFFISVEELFAYAEGGQWWVGHYLFEKR